jgi:hypothetical protein
LRQSFRDDLVHRGPLAGQELIKDRLGQQSVPEPVSRRLAIRRQDRRVGRRAQRGDQFVGWVLGEELEEFEACGASEGGKQTNHVAYARRELTNSYVGEIAYGLGHA